MREDLPTGDLQEIVNKLRSEIETCVGTHPMRNKTIYING